MSRSRDHGIISRLLQYNFLQSHIKLVELFSSIIVKNVKAIAIPQVLAWNIVDVTNLDNQDP